MINLLINASHAIDDMGEILLRTSHVGDSILIQVEDTGSGIKPEHFKKVFDPFFTTKVVGKGTGLGLWISATIIQNHGGVLEVESIVGTGTTFTVKLPVLRAEHNVMPN